MKLWHAGIAVSDLGEAIDTWKKVGFALKHTFEKDEPRAHAAMMIDEDGKGLELWQFASDSPLNEYVGRHFAFLSDDVKKELRLLSSVALKWLSHTQKVLRQIIYSSRISMVHSLK